ncbi:MAG: protein kinase domain-containing protein, partial [Planctomycetota bacterium]
MIAPSPHGALYRIEETGAFGALKLIDPALSADKAVFRKWIDYMRAVQDVPRTATLRPVQHSREGGVDYVTRPYVPQPGRSLRSRLETKAPLSAEEVLNEATAIFASLAAFHSLRMAHGNLKPENVLLSEGAVQLTDPGLAILLQGLPVEDRLLRLADRARYAAPEVLQGAEPTPASDVYSAGRILEDLLALAGGEGSAQAARSPTLAKLGEIAAAFTSADASERPPSAKEALRELQRAANPESAVAKDERPAVPRRSRRSGRLALKRLLDPAVAGVLLLAAAAVWLGGQNVAWTLALSRGDGASREAEISKRLILDSVRSLESWAARSRPPLENVRARWDALFELFQGTDFEAIVASAAERSLRALEGPLDPETATAFERVRAFASRRQWVEALEALAESEDRVRKHPDWKGLETALFEGVYSDLAMVYVPRGDVRLDCAKSGRVVRVPAFLVDAALARDNASRPSTAASGDSAGPPARWLRLEEAQRLARRNGKRLLTLAEWRRLFEYVRSEEPGAADASKRIEGIGGPLLEWVECADADSLSKAGYGWCVGGTRPGVPPTHPLRRWAAYGYPDVAVRFAKSIEAPR